MCTEADTEGGMIETLFKTVEKLAVTSLVDFCLIFMAGFVMLLLFFIKLPDLGKEFEILYYLSIIYLSIFIYLSFFFFFNTKIVKVVECMHFTRISFTARLRY